MEDLAKRVMDAGILNDITIEKVKGLQLPATSSSAVHTSALLPTVDDVPSSKNLVKIKFTIPSAQSEERPIKMWKFSRNSCAYDSILPVLCFIIYPIVLHFPMYQKYVDEYTDHEFNTIRKRNSNMPLQAIWLMDIVGVSALL